MIKKLQNRRLQTILIIIFSVLVIGVITVTGMTMSPDAYATSFENKNLPPSSAHLFGTDWMGRDMFMRTIKGLSTSI